MSVSAAEDDDDIIRVDVDLVAAQYNPLKDVMWYCIDGVDDFEACVDAAVRADNLLHPTDASIRRKLPGRMEQPTVTEQHAQRVAWIVKHWNDEPTFTQVPISIDFGIGAPPTFFSVNDGNHRLAAAIYLKKPFLHTTWGGSYEEMRKFLYKEKDGAADGDTSVHVSDPVM